MEFTVLFFWEMHSQKTQILFDWHFHFMDVPVHVLTWCTGKNNAGIKNERLAFRNFQLRSTEVGNEKYACNNNYMYGNPIKLMSFGNLFTFLLYCFSINNSTVCKTIIDVKYIVFLVCVKQDLIYCLLRVFCASHYYYSVLYINIIMYFL